MDRIIEKSVHSVGCPLLRAIEDGNGGRLQCPKGSFSKGDIFSHVGGWALNTCFDCGMSQPRFDPFGLNPCSPV